MFDISRLKQQLEFIREIDKIKTIFRKTKLFCIDRFENDAEHSWHIALMAVVLLEHADRQVDIAKVVKMLLIHDIVEIDAGDTIVYSKTADTVVAEEKAAKRIFGILPAEQRDEFISLWHEFEEHQSDEAKFASAIDRLEPFLQNLYRDGEGWQRNRISRDQVKAVNSRIGDGARDIWDYLKRDIDKIFDGE